MGTAVVDTLTFKGLDEHGRFVKGWVTSNADLRSWVEERWVAGWLELTAYRAGRPVGGIRNHFCWTQPDLSDLFTSGGAG